MESPITQSDFQRLTNNAQQIIATGGAEALLPENTFNFCFKEEINGVIVLEIFSYLTQEVGEKWHKILAQCEAPETPHADSCR